MLTEVVHVVHIARVLHLEDQRRVLERRQSFFDQSAYISAGRIGRLETKTQRSRVIIHRIKPSRAGCERGAIHSQLVRIHHAVLRPRSDRICRLGREEVNRFTVLSEARVSILVDC